MAEYIKKEDIEQKIQDGLNNLVLGHDVIEVLGMIYEMPTADVAPVRHGRWDDEHKCTVCHNEAFYKISNIRPDYDYDWEENLVETGDYIWDIEWIETPYCPHCGALMDGDRL